ncbi:MAG: type II toxin-antitoxin system HicB family antitoxin [Roseiarcus sp.]
MHAELGASTRSEEETPVNDYPVIIEALTDADGGGFLATVPDLPGCMSDGETREEAARNIEDAIACWIEEAQATGRAVPAPRVAPRIA